MLFERRCDKEDFLFCKPLTTTTKAVDVKELVGKFFKDNNLSWDMVSAVSSDGAPAMLGQKSGFGALVKANAPHIIVFYIGIPWQLKSFLQNRESIASFSGMYELCAKQCCKAPHF